MDPERRDRILDAAFAEFADHGLVAASTNRIAREAGVSKALLFYHFDGKEGLFAAVVGRVSQELFTRVRPPSVPPTDPPTFWAAFAELVGQLQRALADRPDVRAFVVAFARTEPLAVDHPALAEAVAATTAVLDGLLQAGRAVGAIRTDLPPDLQRHLLRTLALAVDTWLLREGPESLPPERVVDLYRRLLAP
jgi:AcrR family transcriptional regulator